MKFRDGMWLTAEGKRLEYAEDIYTITPREDGKAVSLLCPTRNIRSRGDTLNLSTLTVVSSIAFRKVPSILLSDPILTPYRTSKLPLMA